MHEANDEEMELECRSLLFSKLLHIVNQLGKSELEKVIHVASQLTGSARSLASTPEAPFPNPRLRVNISYTKLPPFWAESEEVNHSPDITCFDVETGRPLERPAGINFEICPDTPPGLVFDTLTGKLSGRPMIGAVTAQYTVRARVHTGKLHASPLGWCAFCFVVLPLDVAQICCRALSHEQHPRAVVLTPEPMDKLSVSQDFVDHALDLQFGVPLHEKDDIGHAGSTHDGMPCTIGQSRPSSSFACMAPQSAVSKVSEARPSSAPLVSRSRPFSARSKVRPLGSPLTQRIAGSTQYPWWHGAGTARLLSDAVVAHESSACKMVQSVEVQRPQSSCSARGDPRLNSRRPRSSLWHGVRSH
jgi:hypothetical protein